MRFSQRHGYRPIRETVQLESMDDGLRSRLWSILQVHYWDRASHGSGIGYGAPVFPLLSPSNQSLLAYCKSLWFEYFERPVDEIDDDFRNVLNEIRRHFFNCEWFDVYDFVEFTANNFPEPRHQKSHFMEKCNKVLKDKVSGYRFVDGVISPITNEQELQSIEDAVESGRNYGTVGPVSRHVSRALELLSDRANPDYRNSVKESISAIEALTANVTGVKKGKIAPLLNELEKRAQIHGAMKEAFNKLYGYSSDESGIRHALAEKDIVDFDDAKFMLVTCSAFINYVYGKINE